VLLDGTWNTVNDNTNVWRLKSLLASQGRDGLEQISYYSVGVGTAFGERLRRLRHAERPGCTDCRGASHPVRRPRVASGSTAARRRAKTPT